MDSRLSTFQVVLLAIFGVFVVVGMLFFAGVLGKDSAASSVGPIRIWGTLNGNAVQAVIRQLSENDDSLRQVTYEQKDEATFDADLANALASGTGPDLFLLRQDQIMSDASKVLTIPYSSLSQETFSTTFIDEAHLYMTQDGILGIPVTVDPLVLYWNKDMLAAAGYVQPPQQWSDVNLMAQKLTKRDDSGGIVKSAIAMGAFSNVDHAKDILSTLVMQAAGYVTARDSQDRVVSALAANNKSVLQPGESALRFYTQFADPSQNVYSWNNSLKDSRDAFIAGDLAFYLGNASELPLIKASNPNLNFAVALLPQAKNTAKSEAESPGRIVSFGTMYAFAIPRATASATGNTNGAFAVAKTLASADASSQLSGAWGMQSPRRDVLAQGVDGPQAVFRSEAIIADAWLDPNPTETDKIFQGMIDNVTSGALRLADSVQRADKQIAALLGQ